MADDQVKATGDQAAVKKESLKVEAIVELSDDRNRNFLLPWLTEVELRGRFDWANCRGKTADGGSVAMTVDPDDLIRSCPNVPGICIELSSQRRIARLYDPLALPENKELMEMVQRAILNGRGDKQGPMREINFDNMDENEIKTWAYGLRRLVDGRQCRVLRGKVPTIDELRRTSGKIVTREFDPKTDEPKMVDVPKRYRPPFEEVPGKPNEREVVMVAQG
jgi:hypothetical protein